MSLAREGRGGRGSPSTEVREPCVSWWLGKRTHPQGWLFQWGRYQRWLATCDSSIDWLAACSTTPSKTPTLCHLTAEANCQPAGRAVLHCPAHLLSAARVPSHATTAAAGRHQTSPCQHCLPACLPARPPAACLHTSQLVQASRLARRGKAWQLRCRCCTATGNSCCLCCALDLNNCMRKEASTCVWLRCCRVLLLSVGCACCLLSCKVDVCLQSCRSCSEDPCSAAMCRLC